MPSEFRNCVRIDTPLVTFMEEEVLPGMQIEPDQFWSTLAALFRNFGTRNAALLDKRSEMQTSIDSWHHQRQGADRQGHVGWAAPDQMADMLDAKISHPMVGANCAWVPASPRVIPSRCCTIIARC